MVETSSYGASLLVTSATSTRVLPSALGRDHPAEPLQQRAGGGHVGQLGHVLQHHRARGQQRRAEGGQRRVLGRARRDLTPQGRAALDDEARRHQQPSRRAAPEAQTRERGPGVLPAPADVALHAVEIPPRPDAGESLGGHERGERARLLLADLHQQPPARLQHRGRARHDAAEHGEAVRTAVQRGARLVARHLGRQRRDHRARQVRRVRHHQVEARGERAERREEIPREQPHPRREPERADVAGRDREGARRQLDGQHLRAGQRGRERAGDGAAAGAEVGDHRVRAARERLQRPLHQAFGLRARHQHVGGDGQRAGRGTLPSRAGTAAARGARAARPAPGSGRPPPRSAGASARDRGRSARRPGGRRAATRPPARAVSIPASSSAAAARPSSAGTVESAATPITSRSPRASGSARDRAARRSARRDRPRARRAAGAA